MMKRYLRQLRRYHEFRGCEFIAMERVTKHRTGTGEALAWGEIFEGLGMMLLLVA